MPTLLSSRPLPVEPAARRRRRVPLRLVAAGAGVAVLVPVGMQVAGWLPDDPFGQDVVDRSTTPLLLALEDLHEYHAATGTFQVVVDREVDTRYVPSVISGERVEFLATGTADAYVDFSVLDDGAVTLSTDGTTATIELPAPRLDDVRIDPEESRVLDRDRGLVERIGGAIGDDPVDDNELYALAEDRLAAAAAESDLRERAETNTRAMLTGLAGSLGVDQVEVSFAESADDAG
ncbi:MAG: putative secreted protein [uncultured Blastococcus sp.]|uniref:Putative secreted protein n=1 Tax=uncultured Blastococcus sp. TaxID=217144 RepID=A0A6J4H3L7_9ACTN|nr:MAG: putative secreted protein [uncultured Blastococcus sp.]